MICKGYVQNLQPFRARSRGVKDEQNAGQASQGAQAAAMSRQGPVVIGGGPSGGGSLGSLFQHAV
jgi:hypothetical protein